MEVSTSKRHAPADQLRHAEDAIGRVLSVFPDDAMAHFLKGEMQRAGAGMCRYCECLRGRHHMNPSLAQAYGALGAAKIRVGHSAEACAPLQMAIKLSPRDCEPQHLVFLTRPR